MSEGARRGEKGIKLTGRPGYGTFTSYFSRAILPTKCIAYLVMSSFDSIFIHMIQLWPWLCIAPR